MNGFEGHPGTAGERKGIGGHASSISPIATNRKTQRNANKSDKTVFMSLKETLRADLTAGMKSRAPEVPTLRMVLAAVMNAEVAGTEAKELSDDEVLTVLRKEAKKRAEAAEAFTTAGRSERADAERAELAVIERYLPAALDDASLQRIVDEEVTATGATSPKDMGVVVKAVRARVEGQADGGRIAAMVKAALS